MNVLITGATGLIGKAICKQLLEKGVVIHYLTTSKNKIEKQSSYKGFYWNPEANEIDINAFNNVDVIINLAGASISKRWTTAYKKEIRESRTLTLNLLYNTIAENNIKIKQLISSSAIGYYPDSLTHYYEEDFVAKGDSFLTSVVHDWEDAANQFEKLNIKVAIVRTGIVLDKNGGALPQIVKPIKNYVGAPLGSGEQWQSWIHIDDIAGIYVYIFSNQLTGIYNGVAPNPITQEYLTKAIARSFNRPLILPKIPAALLKIMLGEMHVLITQGQRVSAEKIRKLGYQFKFYDIQDALNNLLT